MKTSFYIASLILNCYALYVHILGFTGVVMYNSAFAGALGRSIGPIAIRAILITLAAFALSACVTTDRVVKEAFEKAKPPIRVVVMDPDVNLGELTAGGVTVPNDEWSLQAKTHIRTHLKNKMGALDVETVYMQDQSINDDQEIGYMQTMFEVVGNAIQNHDIRPILQLPTKKNNFYWTMGPTVARLREQYDADFALMTWVHDTYSSPDRVALIVVGAILGIGIQGGVQQGYMGLVDLSDGRVVWFNRIQRGFGDLRTAEAAEGSVEFLMGNFPLAKGKGKS